MSENELSYIEPLLVSPDFEVFGKEVYGLENRKDLLLSRSNLEYYAFPYGPYQTPESFLKRASELHEELRNKYDIAVVPYQAILNGEESSRGNKLGFDMVRKKVEGMDLENEFASGSNLVPAESVSRLIRNLCRYMDEKILSGEDILQDIYKPENYVYGNLVNQPEKDIYLVDTDPEFISTNFLENENSRQRLEQMIGEMHAYYVTYYHLLTESDWQPAYEHLRNAARHAYGLLKSDTEREYIEGYLQSIEQLFNK